ILKRYAFVATVFVVSSHLGGTNTWDQGKVPQAGLMGAKEIEKMQEWGVAVGSHSVSHRLLTELASDEAWREIAGSRSALERVLKTNIRSFSYPYGRSNPALRDMVAQAGYVGACGIEQRQHLLANMSRIDAARCRGADLRWRMEISGLRFRLRQHLSRGKL